MQHVTPFSLRIFVADGVPDGLRIVEKSNCIGKALVFPRALLSQVKARPELGRIGVLTMRCLDLFCALQSSTEGINTEFNSADEGIAVTSTKGYSKWQVRLFRQIRMTYPNCLKTAIAASCSYPTFSAAGCGTKTA